MKAFNIAKDPKYDEYQSRLVSMLYKFFWYENISGSDIKNEIISNKELADELHKPIIRNFNKRKVHLPIIDNIWVTDLACMQLISKFDKGFRFLLCVTDIYSKYSWVISLKDRKGITITNAFQKCLDESNRKSNKIWVHNGSKFYKLSIKFWLEKNGIEMYSTHNKRKSVIAERFI